MALSSWMIGGLLLAWAGSLRGAQRTAALWLLSLGGVLYFQLQGGLTPAHWLLVGGVLLMVWITWLIVRPLAHPTRLGFLAGGLWWAAGVGMLPHGPWLMLLILGGVALRAGEALLMTSDDLRRRASVAWSLMLVAGLALVKLPGTLEWLGVSYLVLRLLSMVADYRAGRLPPLSASETFVYALFPASWLAGPIDRAPTFVAQLRDAAAPDWVRGVERLAMGAFKKFVIADTLALAALSPSLAGEVNSAGGAWLVTYLYALRIFFDFSGYSDMAIGAGLLAGIRLPENFNRPYLRPTLALFWQHWHMSLTGWFRAYVFMPLSRDLLRRRWPVPVNLIAQVVTMLLIGAWHGLTLNFLAWGLWHALGLVGQRALAQRTRARLRRWNEHPWRRRALYGLGVFLTFHYVAIGWVFFALDTPAESLRLLGVMFGV